MEDDKIQYLNHFLFDEVPTHDLVHLCLFRIRTDLYAPFVEYYCVREDGDKVGFPTFTTTALQEGVEEDDQETVLRNEALQEVFRLLNVEDEALVSYDDMPVEYKGVYNTPDKTYVFIDVRLLPSGTAAAATWKIVDEFLHAPSDVQWKADEPALFQTHATLSVLEMGEEEVVPPRILYHAGVMPVRSDHAVFGFFFYLKEEPTETEKAPMIYFPCPVESTCYILKKELQDVPQEVLEKYGGRFQTVGCIVFKEGGQKVWCVKDILRLGVR